MISEFSLLGVGMESHPCSSQISGHPLHQTISQPRFAPPPAHTHTHTHTHTHIHTKWNGNHWKLHLVAVVIADVSYFYCHALWTYMTC